MLSRNLSIEDKILKLLFEPKHKYKGVLVSAIGIPILFDCKKQSISNAIYRLSKNGCVRKSGDVIFLLPKAKKYIENKKSRLLTFNSLSRKSFSKNFMVMFDIPESKKAEREWFRSHLKKFGYKMIQRSVWVGSSLLPKDFTEYLKEIKLENCIKIFKLTKS
jgi:CRISPR-associated endonuclease Cas2